MFSKMTIRSKILVLIGVIFALFGSALVWAIFSSVRTTDRFAEFVDKDQVALLNYTEMYVQGFQMATALRNVQLDPDSPQGFDNLTKAAVDFDKAMHQAIEGSARFAGSRESLEKIKGLREKQKARRMYGILEEQFRDYFQRADMKKGVTGENLLTSLERRLDNTIYRLGFASSRNQARQLVRHGVFTLNGRRVNIPSLQVKVGDVIEVRERNRQSPVIQEAQQVIARRGAPAWLEVEGEKLKGKVIALPTREDVQFPINEQLIVELYSK